MVLIGFSSCVYATPHQNYCFYSVNKVYKSTSKLKMNSNRTKLYTLSLIPIFFFTSYILLSFYTGGDQYQYHKAYQALSSAKITDSILVLKAYTSGSEPLTAFILWVGASLRIDKNIYISIWNVFLLVGLFLLLRKYKSPSYVITLFLTNFYVVVVMTGAERLKFSLILLVYAALVANKLASSFLLLSSPFAHLQSFLFLGSLFFGKFGTLMKETVLSLRVSRQKLVLFLTLLLIIIIAFIYLQSNVFHKGVGYLKDDIELTELFQSGILLIILLIVVKNRIEVLFSLFPLLFAALLIGNYRVNMIAVTFAFYCFLLQKKLTHPLVVLLLIYFSLKSAPFVYNIFQYRSGFV